MVHGAWCMVHGAWGMVPRRLLGGREAGAGEAAGRSGAVQGVHLAALGDTGCFSLDISVCGNYQTQDDVDGPRILGLSAPPWSAAPRRGSPGPP